MPPTVQLCSVFWFWLLLHIKRMKLNSLEFLRGHQSIRIMQSEYFIGALRMFYVLKYYLTLFSSTIVQLVIREWFSQKYVSH